MVSDQRSGVNFIQGTDITLTVADDAGNDRVNVTIANNLPDAGASTRGAVTSGAQTFGGNKIFNGSVAIGGGDPIKKTLVASATLNFPIVSAGASSDLTITVTGAADADLVTLGVPVGSMPTGAEFGAWVSATDTVTVQYRNKSGSSQNPASGTFWVKVEKVQ